MALNAAHTVIFPAVQLLDTAIKRLLRFPFPQQMHLTLHPGGVIETSHPRGQTRRYAPCGEYATSAQCSLRRVAVAFQRFAQRDGVFQRHTGAPLLLRHWMRGVAHQSDTLRLYFATGFIGGRPCRMVYFVLSGAGMNAAQEHPLSYCRSMPHGWRLWNVTTRLGLRSGIMNQTMWACLLHRCVNIATVRHIVATSINA
ncbi:hypothetical protein KCP70_01975 [Salmonella enterica subsp. enterica]|nr:hypothetical protein KCP70_01975 [Salmonella enterica subsp. enterica]